MEAGTGIVDLRGAVGGTTPLSSLTIGSAGTAKLNDATTTGAQSVTAGTIQTNGVHTTTTSEITLTGTVVLQNSTTLSTGSGAGNITVTGAINGTSTGTQSLTLTAGTGDVLFQGSLGATTTLNSLTINSARDVTFMGTVNTSGGLTQSSGTGTSTLKGGAVGGALSLTTNAITVATSTLTTVGTAVLNAQNAVSFNADLNATANTISILANQDGAGTEGFTQASGVSITTTNNTSSAVAITVNTSGGGTGGATLGTINAGSTLGQVTVAVNGGGVTDSNGVGNNISAFKFVVTSGTGLVSLDTTVTEFDIVSTTGTVSITNVLSTATTVTRMNTGTGNLTFNQSGGGKLNVIEMVATSGDVRIDNTVNVSVDEVGATGQTITINSGGDIKEFGADSLVVDLLATTIVLNAVTDIGETTNFIEYTSINPIITNSGTGNVFVQSVP
ncbi:MAG TPA: hypothetical protein EYQ01_09605 [Nitrospira sp.]|nr:hypothetical protein [Candidatus Manganitrophaceae bacterium]